jgi:hypothetical protein
VSDIVDILRRNIKDWCRVHFTCHRQRRTAESPNESFADILIVWQGARNGIHPNFQRQQPSDAEMGDPENMQNLLSTAAETVTPSVFRFRW